MHSCVYVYVCDYSLQNLKNKDEIKEKIKEKEKKKESVRR